MFPGARPTGRGWFRFWLQDYERPNVDADSAQYERWRALRDQHRQNEAWLAAGKDPTKEPYCKPKAD